MYPYTFLVPLTKLYEQLYNNHQSGQNVIAWTENMTERAAETHILNTVRSTDSLENLEQAYKSLNSVSYRFTIPNGENWLLKIMNPQSRSMREIAGSYPEKIQQFELIDRVMRRYYGRNFVGGRYILLNSLDTPQIALLRPEVVGTVVEDLPRYSGERLGFFDKLYEWQELWSEMLCEPELNVLHPNTKKVLVVPDFSMSNTIFVAPESYYIIDW